MSLLDKLVESIVEDKIMMHNEERALLMEYQHR